MDRFEQISRTLPLNLKDNLGWIHFLEFVIVDFGEDDQLEGWLFDNYKNYIEFGYIKYFRTTELPNWHMSIAKNTSHYLATGKILMNLDCDNYTGHRGGEHALSFFGSHGEKSLLHQFSGKKGDGTCGKIAVHRKFFYKVGGYDESFKPAGYQDIDLIARLKEFGLVYYNITRGNLNQTIKNSKHDCIFHCDTELSWEEMEAANRNKSIGNLASGQIVANGGNFGIRKNLYQHNGKVLKRMSRLDLLFRNFR